MNVQHRHAEAGRRGAGLCDGVRDVVELEIEEDAKSALDHPANRFRTGDDEQLLADLEPAGRGIEAVGQRERVHRVREIERDDDFRGIGHHDRYPSGVSVRRGE